MNEREPEMHDEDLVAWLLDPAARAKQTRAQLEENEDVADRLTSYDRFLGDCRSELHATETIGAKRLDALNEEILTRTTREKHSWGVSIQRRFGSSVILRVLAASLLLHMAVLPALAYYTLVQPQSTTRIGFEFPNDEANSLFADSNPEPDLESAQVPVDDERALDSLTPELTGGVLGQNSWGSPLDLVLHCKLLMDLASRGSTSGAGVFQEQLDLSLLRLRSELLGLDEAGEANAVARLLASEWLRAVDLGLVAVDALLNARCGRILGLSPSAEPDRLTEAGWELTFEEAQRGK